MLSSTPRTASQRIASGRFAYLMGLYGENYWRITQLFAPQRLATGTWISRAGDDIDVRLDVVEKHPYTLELQLSYLFDDDVTGKPDPSAHIRLYTDAQAAEVTTCYFGPRLEDVLGRYADSRAVFDHRLRMNNFFSKWLEYLGERGHSRFTLQVAGTAGVA